MSAYRYLTGRRTTNGVEICQYYMQGRPNEDIVVLGYGKSEVIAAVICNRLNQGQSSKSIIEDQPLPGGY